MLKNLWGPLAVIGVSACSSNDTDDQVNKIAYYECNNQSLPGRRVTMTKDGDVVHYVASDRGVVLAEGDIKAGNVSGVEQTRERLTELVCDDTAARDGYRKLIRKFDGTMAETDPAAEFDRVPQ